MITRGEVSLRDLNLEGIIELQRNPELAEILIPVCQELYKIVSNLVDEKQPVRHLLVIVQELKDRIEPDSRPSLRIRPRYTPDEC